MKGLKNMNIREFIDYIDGVLYWRKFPNNHYKDCKIGDPVGTVCTDHMYKGYMVFCFDGKQQFNHNAIWEGFYGPIPPGKRVDHIDGNRSNNKIDNLRLCDHAQNMWNTGLSRRNKTGVKGLSWYEKEQAWIGQIVAYGKSHQKRSKDRETVEKWLVETRNRLHGEFANHGKSKKEGKANTPPT